jgi:hypothetical protein
MNHLAAIALAFFAAAPVAAQEFTSDYTKVDQQNDGCHVIARAAEGEGEWAELVCPGYGHYPYVLSYGDGREQVTYGFASSSVMPSFAPFNYANDTVEWRLVTENNAKRPVAAIQRWFLADQDGKWATQILVVSKVGQPDGSGEACLMGYIDAADGAPANERARKLADRALDWECGSEIAVEDAVQEFAPTP